MADDEFITLHWNAKDIRGRRFGRLVTLGPLKSKNGSVVWLCQCDCGNTAKVKSSFLVEGVTQSCGCIRRERGALNKTHGMRHTPEYNVWNAIKHRCNNPNTKCFESYGGRGIKMCDRWLSSFENFIEDMGRRPTPKHSVERSDNNGNYEPTNCYWATAEVQRRNTRRSRIIEFRGERLNLVDAAKKYNLEVRTLWHRLKIGWPVEKALLTPVKSLQGKHHV